MGHPILAGASPANGFRTQRARGKHSGRAAAPAVNRRAPAHVSPVDDAAPATTVSTVAQGEPATAHRLTRSRAMRTARYLICLSLLTAATMAPAAAGAADTPSRSLPQSRCASIRSEWR